MEVPVRTLAIAAGTAALVAAVAYAVGHRRGRGREQRLNLARYRFRKRVLLVFAPNVDDPEFQEQMGQLASQSGGVRERDIKVVPILADGRGGEASRADAGMLCKAHGVPRQAFRVVLIRKDGTVERVDDRPLPVERLFRIVDDAPTRPRAMAR